LTANKRCPRCHKMRRKPPRSYCTTCQAAFWKEWRATLSHQYRTWLDLQKGRSLKASRERARNYIYTYLQAHPCIDCGCQDVRCLTFDHVRGKKKANVSRMLINGCSVATVAAEVAKCEVRCCNCHQIKTARERGFARSLQQFGA
jgi:hypothetical protein